MSSTGPDISRLRIDRTEPAATRRSAPLPVRIGILVLLLAIAMGAGAYFAPNRTASETRLDKAPLGASTQQVSSPAIIPIAASGGVLDATGYVVAQRKAAVSSKATGRLKELNVTEGDTVEQGQVIGVLENEDTAALLAQEQASLGAAEARVSFADAELSDAALGWERAQKLSGERVIAKSESDGALARFRKAKAEVDLARANVALARSRIEKAKVDLEYTLIRAPFSGTVLTKDADVGEIVAPFGSSVNSRAAVVTMADMSSLEVEAGVSEANLAKVYVGQKCSITLDSYPGKEYAGEVGGIVPTVDRAKATVQVKIRFLERDTTVIPEMSARVRFTLKK